MAGTIAVLSLLPAARCLNAICPARYIAVLAVLAVEAAVCLAMLAGKIHWRMADLQAWQAATLATALHAGRLDDGERDFAR